MRLLRRRRKIRNWWLLLLFRELIFSICWSQWPHDLRLRFVAARLLRSWGCMLWGRGLCDELITHPEESYQLWYIVVCDLETSRMRRPWLALGRSATKKKKKKKKKQVKKELSTFTKSEPTPQWVYLFSPSHCFTGWLVIERNCTVYSRVQ